MVTFHIVMIRTFEKGQDFHFLKSGITTWKLFLYHISQFNSKGMCGPGAHYSTKWNKYSALYKPLVRFTVQLECQTIVTVTQEQRERFREICHLKCEEWQRNGGQIKHSNLFNWPTHSIMALKGSQMCRSTHGNSLPEGFFIMSLISNRNLFVCVCVRVCVCRF
jgi:hypothetical protein